MRLRGLALSFAALAFMFAAADRARADPLTFGNVVGTQAGHTVSLFDNPGATFTNGTRVSFLVDVAGTLPHGGADMLRLTVGLADGSTLVQSFAIPIFGTTPPPFTLLASFDFPTYYQAVPLTLTVDLLNSTPDFVIPSGPNAGQRVDSQTYTFSVVQPVPEPATILLLGTGLAGVIAGARKRRGGRGRPPAG